MSVLDEVGAIAPGYEHCPRSSTRRRPSRRAAACSSGTTSPRASGRSRATIAALARAGLEEADRARRARAASSAS